MEPRYRLENTSQKHNCPNCGKRTFVRYVDTETGNYSPEQFGRCDRADNCAYHAMPPMETKCYLMQFDSLTDYSDKAYRGTDKAGKTDFIPKSQVLELTGNDCWVSEWCLKESKLTYQTNEYKYFGADNCPVVFTPGKQPKEPPVIKPTDYIPANLFKASLQEYDRNNFVKYLTGLFGLEITNQLITRYFIGTSKHKHINKEFPGHQSESGSCIFWEIDTNGKIRTGKIMLYNPETGKRVKQPFNHVSWVHNWINQPKYELLQCFFGEHLLQDKTMPVAIVESEKTAIIASVYLPRFIWLAAGMKGGLNIDKCSILKGRNVTLFPDIKAYSDWTKKANKLSDIARVRVSDLLESKASPAEREQGLDIADYLIRFDWQQFREPEQHEPVKPTMEPEQPRLVMPIVRETPETEIDWTGLTGYLFYLYMNPVKVWPESWDKEISELERYFTGITTTAQPIVLNQGTTITNIQLFIDSHLKAVKANSGNPTFQPYLERLIQLKSAL